MRAILAILILMLGGNLLGQSMDVESDRFEGVETVTTKSLNGCCAKKGYRAKYWLDENGRAYKSLNYFKKKKLAEFEYEYNEQGYLALRIQTFSINHTHRVDSVTYEYEFDSDGRLIREIKCSRGLHSIVSEYSDFDERDNAQTESRSFNDRAQFEWRKRYDEQDRLTWIAKFQSDSIESENKIEYNDFSDVSASTITYYPEDEEVTYMGGTRHSPIESYEYVYDSKGRWIAKYVLFKGRRVLHEKRRFDER